MKIVIKTIILVMGFVMVLVGVYAYINKDDFYYDHLTQNYKYQYTDTIRQDVLTLGLNIDTKQEGDYRELVENLYVTFNTYYRGVMDNIELRYGHLTERQFMEELQTNGPVRQEIASDPKIQGVLTPSFNRMASVQALEGAKYTINDVKFIVEPDYNSGAGGHMLRWYGLYLQYGWIGYLSLGFLCILAGVITLMPKKNQRFYSDEDEAKIDELYDEYYKHHGGARQPKKYYDDERLQEHDYRNQIR